MQGGSAPAASGGARASGVPGSYGGAIVHGPQGAAMIPSRDGLAITTDAAHAAAQGPSVVNVPDGVAVTSAPPKPEIAGELVSFDDGANDRQENKNAPAHRRGV